MEARHETAGRWKAEDHGPLFKRIFEGFLERFNWGCFDGFGNNGIGQFGAAYSLLLFKEYGGQEQFGEYYAEKYFAAFPSLYLLPFTNLWGHPLDTQSRKRAFLTRNFYRNLPWWGFLETYKIDHGLISDIQYRIKKTPLLDHFIQLRA